MRTASSAKSAKRQVLRQRHRPGRGRPVKKGGATRHRKPLVKDVFKFTKEDVSLGDAEQQLDGPSGLKAVKDDSAFAMRVRDYFKDYLPISCPHDLSYIFGPFVPPHFALISRWNLD